MLGQLGEVVELKNKLLTKPLKGNFAKLLGIRSGGAKR